MVLSVREKINNGAVIIDVRTKEEYNDGHYKNALNIPVKDLPNHLDSLGEKDKTIIVYCASGARSALAAKILKKSGYTDVTNAGGLEDMPD